MNEYIATFKQWNNDNQEWEYQTIKVIAKNYYDALLQIISTKITGELVNLEENK